MVGLEDRMRRVVRGHMMDDKVNQGVMNE